MKSSDIEYTPELSVFHIDNMWTAQFIGRKFVDGSKPDYQGRIELYDERYYRYLQIEKDDNGCIKEIVPHKISDNSPAHGRPITKSLNFGAGDINTAIKELFDKTEARVNLDDLKHLVAKFSAAHPDSSLKLTSSKLTFEFEEISAAIPVKKLIEYLEISMSYLGIIKSEQFWEANDYLKQEYREPVMALFSLIDISSYPDCESLEKSLERAQHLSEALPKYKMLCEAVKENNTALVDALIEYSQLDIYGDNINALFEAIVCKNDNLVNKLVDARAYANERCILKTIETGNKDLFLRLLELKGDLTGNETLTKAVINPEKYDYLVELIKHGAHYLAFNLPVDKLIELSAYPNVDFSQSSICELYEAEQHDVLKVILERLVKNHPVEAYKAKTTNSYNYANFALIHKAISDGSIDEAKKIVDIFYTPMSKKFALYMLENVQTYPLSSEKYIAEILCYAVENRILDCSGFDEKETETFIEFIMQKSESEKLYSVLKVFPGAYNNPEIVKKLVGTFEYSLGDDKFAERILTACEDTYMRSLEAELDKDKPKLPGKIPASFKKAQKLAGALAEKSLLYLHSINLEDRPIWYSEASETVFFIQQNGVHIDDNISGELRYIIDYLNDFLENHMRGIDFGYGFYTEVREFRDECVELISNV